MNKTLKSKESFKHESSCTSLWWHLDRKLNIRFFSCTAATNSGERLTLGVYHTTSALVVVSVILNGLRGFFIMLIYCVVSSEVRKKIVKTFQQQYEMKSWSNSLTSTKSRTDYWRFGVSRVWRTRRFWLKTIRARLCSTATSQQPAYALRVWLYALFREKFHLATYCCCHS